MKKQTTATLSVDPKITVSDNALNNALHRFNMPYSMTLHTSLLNDDGEEVHMIELIAHANDTLVWEVLQWQMLALIDLTDMRLLAHDDDGFALYLVTGIACKKEVLQ